MLLIAAVVQSGLGTRRRRIRVTFAFGRDARSDPRNHQVSSAINFGCQKELNTLNELTEFHSSPSTKQLMLEFPEFSLIRRL